MKEKREVEVMDKDIDLDALLSKRKVPEMRSNLEHRIIQASLNEAHSIDCDGDKAGVFGVFRDFIDSLVLPQPTLVLSMVLLLGIVMGAYSSDVLQNHTSLEAYIMMGSDMDYGDIL